MEIINHYPNSPATIYQCVGGLLMFEEDWMKQARKSRQVYQPKGEKRLINNRNKQNLLPV